MTQKDKKPSRQKTLQRLEEVSEHLLVDHGALDRAFAAFEQISPDDTQGMQAAQKRLAELLAPKKE